MQTPADSQAPEAAQDPKAAGEDPGASQTPKDGQAPDAAQAPKAEQDPKATEQDPKATEQDPGAQDDESLWYTSKIAMKKDHQKLLWEYCQKKELDYIDMLSLINVESNFNEKCSTGRYKGYFQINSTTCTNLSKILKTQNKPLDGAININWGTTLYSWILTDKRVKDLTGQKKRDVALSIYNRGTGGYDKYGLSKSFLKRFYAKREKLVSYLED